MENRGKNPLRRVILVLAALTMVAAAFVLEGILARENGGRWPWLFGGSAKVAVARVTRVERFTRCRDEVSTVEDVPKEQVAGVVAALSSGWTVVTRGESAVEVRKDTEGYCPEHSYFRLIALYSVLPAEPPVVCVFRGKKADPAYLIREVRGLTEADLYKKERDLLKSGVLIGPGTANPVPDDLDVDEVVASYLQGIAESR